MLWVRSVPVTAQGLGEVQGSTSAGSMGRPSDEAVPPRLVRFVEARYPTGARERGEEATVVLQLTIDPSGRVTEATVLESAGAEFDQAALEAVRQFEFVPARRGGRPVAARIRYRYRFTLATTARLPRGPVAVVRGVVRDGRDRAVAGATVRLQLEGTESFQQVTDAAGGFRFELPRAGVVTVVVSREGFRDYRAEERVFEHDDLQVVYRLVPVSSAPTAAMSSMDGGEVEPGVTVRAVRPAREVTRTTLDRREVLRIPGTGGDALRSIQNLPGLSRAPFLSGALIVRGASPFDTNVFVDGTDLPLLYHFGGLSSVIQTEMLDRIDFYPGNFSVRYGRAMGGTVDVGLRSPRRQGYRGVVNINAVDASVFVEGAITPTVSFAVALRRSWVDAVLNAVLSGIDGIQLTAAPVYYDYQGILEWRPHARHRIRLAVLGDDDSLEILFRRPGDMAPTFAGRVSLATRFHLAQLSWLHDLSPNTQGRAMVSTGWTTLDFVGSEQFRLSLQVLPINVRYELSHSISPRARVHLGFDGVFGPAWVNFDGIRVDPGGGSVRDPSSTQRVASRTDLMVLQPAVYTELELVPLRGVRLLPGLRLDYFHELHRAMVSPRLSARWEFLPDWFAKGGVGLFAQPPRFEQSSDAPNAFFPGQTIGNPNLLPQRAMHYSLGCEHNFSRWVSLSVEGFFKTLDDLVVQTPSVELRRQPPPVPYTNSGIGRIYGMEVLLRHRASERFFGWIAYTLLRSERRDTPTSNWYLFDQDQTHILTALGSYDLGAGWEVGARFRYVTGSPTTPIVGSVYNADTFQYVPIYGERNSTRVADFHQLDVRVDKTWRWRWGTIGVFLEVLNVYNHANQEGFVPSYNYRQQVPLNGLPIFPNLGVRGEI